MRISEILKPSSIAVHLDIQSKQEILVAMVNLINNSGVVTDKQKVQQMILDREKIMSTGVGNGIAIPHAKTDAVQGVAMSVCTMKNPIDFESLDNQPVNLLFMLVGRENAVGTHLRLLSRISRLIGNEGFRKKLLDAETSEEIFRLISEEEQQKLGN